MAKRTLVGLIVSVEESNIFKKINNMKLEDIEELIKQTKELDLALLEKKYEPSDDEEILMYDECSCGYID